MIESFTEYSIVEAMSIADLNEEIYGTKCETYYGKLMAALVAVVMTTQGVFGAGRLQKVSFDSYRSKLILHSKEASLDDGLGFPFLAAFLML